MLSVLETGVMFGIASGLRDLETAEQTGLSEAEVRKCVQEIMRKFELKDRVELILLAHSKESPLKRQRQAA
jgi:DNA-binding NarL/FixJ family response regulator